MGRGRQKAKHTKVARELKYFSPDTNYNALERELAESVGHAPDYEELAAKYDAEFGDEDEESDEESEERAQSA